MMFTSELTRLGCKGSLSHFANPFNWILCCLLTFLALAPARADDRDTEFLRIYTMIQDADSLDKNGQTEAALAKYTQAQAALKKFRLTYPDWDNKVVAFRANYLTGKITELTNKSAPRAPTGSEGETKTAAASFSVKLLEPGAEPRKAIRMHP